MSNIQLINGDCLEEMKKIPDGSVDLVLCDPPYGIMGMEGANHGMAGKVGWDNQINFQAIFKEINRLLRPNGIVAIFSQEPLTSQIISNAHGSIPFLYKAFWKKDHFANALNAKNALLSYIEEICVFSKNFDDFRGHPLKQWFDEELTEANLSRKEAINKWGSTASHYFTDGRQFSIPSREKLKLMQEQTGRFQKTYDELKCVADSFRNSQRNRYQKIFNLPEGKKYKSNVLEYKKDYDGFHPTQKPVKLLEDLVYTYSNEGDTVLDFTMGSGSTGVACKNLNRNFIGIELDKNYFEIANKRIYGTDIDRGGGTHVAFRNLSEGIEVHD